MNRGVIPEDKLTKEDLEGFIRFFEAIDEANTEDGGSREGLMDEATEIETDVCDDAIRRVYGADSELSGSFSYQTEYQIVE